MKFCLQFIIYLYDIEYQCIASYPLKTAYYSHFEYTIYLIYRKLAPSFEMVPILTFKLKFF